MAGKKKENNGLSYEQAFLELEKIVAALETDQPSLEEALKLYERGQELVQFCSGLLEQAELHLQTLSPASGVTDQQGEVESE